MKISKIYIKGFQQFQDVELDFTNPETGLPLDKVCFIGSNGTGKSKLLRLVNWLFTVVFINFNKSGQGQPYLTEGAKVVFKISYINSNYLIFHFNRNSFILRIKNLTKSEEDVLISGLLALKSPEDFTKDEKYIKYTASTLNTEFLAEFTLQKNAKDLLIYSPAESNSNGYKNIIDVPETNVSEALELSKEFPFYAEVSSEKVNVFWKLLVYNLRKRAEERDAYENIPDNLNKTKAKLIEEFDKIHPKVLEHLALVWNRILEKAGLEFDVNGASNPYQLNDNLKAYVKLSNTNSIIQYGNLSTGIRNYIFRLGHIFSLYFNREIERGFLLVDEPENSLFPDFLFDLMDAYKEVVLDKRGENNTQMFFATHNPIVAAQFKPYERIILNWNEDGTVKVNKGITPEGDDPNDILVKDFGLHQLMGPTGILEWNKYLDLKKKLKVTESIEEKMKVASEINKIGQLYNFPG